nr:MAG TPA: hypothetical protein [Caudoviricetes sp.]
MWSLERSLPETMYESANGSWRIWNAMILNCTRKSRIL